MRENKESIIAVLEAFVHDPLINWRLVQGGRQVGGQNAQGGENAAGGAWRPRGDETNIHDDGAVGQINARAVQVVERVQQKLTGAFSSFFPMLRFFCRTNPILVQAETSNRRSCCPWTRRLTA
jgi:FKBP12-rapamycin complex-associated protein